MSAQHAPEPRYCPHGFHHHHCSCCRDRYVAELKQQRDELLAAAEWKPINTAPKDGTKIILAKIAATTGAPEFGIEATPVHVWWAVQGFWSDKYNNWNDGIEPCGLAGPTHWMATPPVPAIAKAKGQQS